MGLSKCHSSADYDALPWLAANGGATAPDNRPRPDQEGGGKHGKNSPILQ